MPQQQQLAIAINIFETLALCSEICFGIEATFTEGYFHAFEVARELGVVIIKVGMLDQTVGKGSWTHVGAVFMMRPCWMTAFCHFMG